MGPMKINTKLSVWKEAAPIELRESPTSSASNSPSTSPPTKPTEKARWRDLPHKDQLAILVLARLTEPLVQTSLQAYMFWQLKSFDTALPDATISWQAGVLQASFSAAQTLTGVLWGRVADRYGRKTVLILGSLGTIVSCLGFGFSHSFISALAFRFLGGLVNGNIAVIRTMVSEVIKEKKYQSRAFLLMPMCYNIGALIGPLIGGVLADPAGAYPSIFGPGSPAGGESGVWWMMNWPYLLPNLTSAGIVVISLATVIFGLHETLDDGTERPDKARMLATRALRAIQCWKSRADRAKYQRLSPSEQQEGFLSNVDSPNDVESKPSPTAPTSKPKPKRKLPFRRIWTPNVLFTLLAHFATAFHLGTFNSLWFIFLSADRYNPSSSNTSHDADSAIKRSENYHPHGPIIFTGGLALPPRLVGLAMSILGLIGITLQLLIYPRVNDKYGVLPPYRIATPLFPIAYFLAPYLSLLAAHASTTEPPAAASGPAVWIAILVVLALFVVGRTFVLPATMLLVNNCAPHPSVLGTIHGVAASVGSAARTLGPAVAGYLFAVGLNVGVVAVAWWVLAGFGCFAVVTALFVRDGVKQVELEDDDDDDDDQESAKTQSQ